MVENLRIEYANKPLDEHTVSIDPVEQFHRWFAEAITAGLPLVNAMTLATAARDGKPSARIVLLKGMDREGVVFYTNYRSRKAKELFDNPRAALLFHWVELDRQVRIEGIVAPVGAGESEEYFQTRPRGSQIGAHASEQSSVLSGRAELEERFRRLEEQFQGRPVPKPEHWGGFRLLPAWFEFWQGRESRLHDRIGYTRLQDSRWNIDRLAP